MRIRDRAAFVALLLGLAACATPPAATDPFHYVQGTHPGDPCRPDGMLIDTPRGYPRVCVDGKWLPLCETTDPKVAAICDDRLKVARPVLE